MRVVKLYRTLILAIALAVPCVSHAEFWGGYALKELADADDRMENGNAMPGDFHKAGQLLGFVIGVYDTFEGTGIICTTKHVKAGQLVAIVKKFTRNNPETWNSPAKTLVFIALSTAFPCKQ